MEENYIIIANLNEEKKREYEEKLKKEEYSIIINKENYIYARKEKNNNENYEKEVIEFFLQVLKKYTNYRELYLDITDVLNYVIENNVQNVSKEGKIRWMIRQLITKAILDNAKED